MFIEAAVWYLVIFLIYYDLHIKFDLLYLEEIYGVPVKAFVGVIGVGVFFIASFVGGFVTLFVVENMRSLSGEIIPEQWSKIRIDHAYPASAHTH